MVNRRFGEYPAVFRESKVRQTLVKNVTGVIHLTMTHKMDTLGTHPPDCNCANCGQPARYAGDYG